MTTVVSLIFREKCIFNSTQIAKNTLHYSIKRKKENISVIHAQVKQPIVSTVHLAALHFNCAFSCWLYFKLSDKESYSLSLD